MRTIERKSGLRCQRCELRRSRRGIEAMEVLLTLPLVVLTLVSGIHFGIAGVTKQTVQCAASAAAYEAALGSGEADIRLAANGALAVHELKIGDGVLLVVETSRGPVVIAGDESLLVKLKDATRRKLLVNEYRAMVVVARDATGIPENIQLKETEIRNPDLMAVATAIKN